MKPRISIVIPVYKSAPVLEELFEQISNYAGDCAEDFEIIAVNDSGGKEETWEKLSELSRANSKIRSVCLMRNFGQHNALLCGVRLARFPICVTLDDDLQNPPNELPRLIKYFQDNDYDVVYGYPSRQQHNFCRAAASNITRLILARAMGNEPARRISAYRVFRTNLRKGFEKYDGRLVSLDVLLTWGTDKFGALAVRHDERKVGKSGYSLRRLLTHSFNLITGFTEMPLRLAGLLGLFITFFGVAIMAYAFWAKFILEQAALGFTFFTSILSIFSGTQLIILGIIGEYLGRIHRATLDMPAYTVIEDSLAEHKGES